MDKPEIMRQTHEQLYDSVRRANNAETKIDLFMDFFWKVIYNDIEHIKCDLNILKKFMWKVIAVFSCVMFILNIVAGLLIRYIAYK